MRGSRVPPRLSANARDGPALGCMCSAHCDCVVVYVVCRRSEPRALHFAHSLALVLTIAATILNVANWVLLFLVWVACIDAFGGVLFKVCCE